MAAVSPQVLQNMVDRQVKFQFDLFGTSDCSVQWFEGMQAFLGYVQLFFGNGLMVLHAKQTIHKIE
jgi:hypothetical protein